MNEDKQLCQIWEANWGNYERWHGTLQERYANQHAGTSEGPTLDGEFFVCFALIGGIYAAAACKQELPWTQGTLL